MTPAMTPERYQRIGQLFAEALDHPSEKRAAFLEESCGQDADLRAAVEKMLAGFSDAGDFFARPALDVAAELLAQQQAQPALLGKQISHYQVLSLLGAGGMGQVYLARDTRLQRQVALKLLPAAFTQDAERVKRFEQEAQAASALNHPNILTIHDFGQTDATNGGLHFIATEYVEGQTLRQLLQAGVLPHAQVIEIALQLADALAAAHQAGIIHRDIKPENIMRRPDGYVKVLDFGLGVFKPLWQPLGKNGIPLAHTLPSSIRHFTPEHINRIPFSPQSDLFSLGTILYELLTGHAAFSGASLYEICAAITCDTPTPLPATAPQALRTVISQLLEKDLTQRIPTAYALLEALRPACHTANTSAGTPARAGSNTDWQLVGALGKGALQQVFDTSPFAVGWCLAVGGMLYVLSSLTMLFGNKH